MAKSSSPKREKHDWDQRDDESKKNYEAFQVYLQLKGNRSSEKVAEKLRKNSSLFRRWAGLFDWKKRAAAYDTWVAEKTEPVRVKAVIERAVIEEDAITRELRQQYEFLEEKQVGAEEVTRISRAAFRMPLHDEQDTTTTLDNGKTIIIDRRISATPFIHHARAAETYERGVDLWLRLSRLKVEKLIANSQSEKPASQATAPEPDNEAREQNFRERLTAFAAEKREEIRAYLATPMPLPPPDAPH